MGASTLLLWITTCYFRYLKYLPKSGSLLLPEAFPKASEGHVQVDGFQGTEHSCLTQMKKKSFLLKANKYTNRFWVRQWKKPLVEMHCPLEDSSQKKATDSIGVKIQRFHLNRKSHLVTTLSLELFICGSSQPAGCPCLGETPSKASEVAFVTVEHHQERNPPLSLTCSVVLCSAHAS